MNSNLSSYLAVEVLKGKGMAQLMVGEKPALLRRIGKNKAFPNSHFKFRKHALMIISELQKYMSTLIKWVSAYVN